MKLKAVTQEIENKYPEKANIESEKVKKAIPKKWIKVLGGMWIFKNIMGNKVLGTNADYIMNLSEDNILGGSRVIQPVPCFSSIALLTTGVLTAILATIYWIRKKMGKKSKILKWCTIVIGIIFILISLFIIVNRI